MEDYWWVSKKFSQTIWYLRKVTQCSTNSAFSGNEELLTSTGDIGKDEVNEGDRKLFSGKALGVDEICPEYLKPVYVLGLSWLICLCRGWDSSTGLTDQEGGSSIDQLKKGDWNYRGSHLLVCWESLFKGTGKELN